MTSSERVPSVDLLKGAAILWVMLIHARPIEHNPVMVHVFNHAAPIFVVLLGFNAGSWWKRRALSFGSLQEWYANRGRRIYLPAWACLAVWWLLVVALQPPGIQLDLQTALLQLAGYWKRIGTGWFVTLLIQAAVILPVLILIYRKLGGNALLAISLVVTTWGLLQIRWIAAEYGMLAWLSFLPVYAAHICFGIWLGESRRLNDRSNILAAIVLTGFAIAVRERGVPGEFTFFMRTFMELPLTLVLLATIRPLGELPYVGAALYWCGKNSYEMYLGQLLAHNALHYSYSPSDPMQLMNRWFYFAILLAGGIGFTKGYDILVRAVRAVRATARA